MRGDRGIAVRVDRLESIEAIRALVARYAQSVDSRDLDVAAGLFVEDGDPTRTDRRTKLAAVLGGDFGVTIHLLGSHEIRMDAGDADRASGTLYCRAEHEYADAWVVMVLQYEDSYVRRDGSWFFESRDLRPFYAVDVLQRPNDHPTRMGAPLLVGKGTVPERSASWGRFWRGVSGSDSPDNLLSIR